jgi:hypothetical protein
MPMRRGQDLLSGQIPSRITKLPEKYLACGNLMLQRERTLFRKDPAVGQSMVMPLSVTAGNMKLSAPSLRRLVGRLDKGAGAALCRKHLRQTRTSAFAPHRTLYIDAVATVRASLQMLIVQNFFDVVLS